MHPGGRLALAAAALGKRQRRDVRIRERGRVDEREGPAVRRHRPGQRKGHVGGSRHDVTVRDAGIAHVVSGDPDFGRIVDFTLYRPSDLE
jgi:hypothetical protein